MDNTLLAIYRAADYHVRLARGGWATIQVDAITPEPLRKIVGSHNWGLITACNPHSQNQTRLANRAAQHDLLVALRKLPETVSIHPAAGAGANPWREPSFFVIGLASAQLDALARRYEQNAYLLSDAEDIARLRWVD